MAAGTVRVRRISATGYDVLEAPLPVVIGGDPGARRAALPVAQGDHGRAIKEIVTRSLADLGLDAATVGGRGGDHDASRQPDAAGRGRDRDRPRHPGRGRRADRRLPRRTEDHLMGALWVVAEPGPDGGAGPHQHGGRHARPRRSASGRPRGHRVSWSPPTRPPQRPISPRYLPLVLDDHGPGGGRPCLVGASPQRHAALPRRGRGARSRSSSARAPTAAIWPAPSRR